MNSDEVYQRFIERKSVINFPAEIEDYAEKSYLSLKAEQKHLIGR